MILLVEGLVKYFNSQVVLNGISWAIEVPGVYSLLGPNGAGKTTFLSILVGVLKPDRGRVLVKDLDPSSPASRRLIGYCPQDPGLIDNITGYDNALFYGRLYNLPGRDIISRLRDLAGRLGLSDGELRMRVGKYSGGMKKKLAIAISLLHDPEVVILDEPTTGLDPGSRRDVWALLLELKREGRTVVLATHSMEEADTLSDRVAIMDRGRIVAEGSPSELKERYGPRAVVQLRFEKELGREAVKVIDRYSAGYYVDKDLARLHVDNPYTLIPKLIEELYSRGYSVVEFKLATPTLEDVFLRLTGRRLSEG